MTSIIDTTSWTKGQSIPQIVFTLGVIGYTAFYKRCFPHHVHMYAGFEFDALVDLAKKRGFKSRRQLIGSVRYGRPTEFAMARIAEVCALITEDEFRTRLARFSTWMHFRETGSLPRGWTFTPPPATAPSADTHQPSRTRRRPRPEGRLTADRGTFTADLNAFPPGGLALAPGRKEGI